MAIYRYLSEMPPLRLLLLAALLAVVIAQVVGMVMVAQSQVQRAALREAAERATRMAGAPAAAQMQPAADVDTPARGFTQVSFAAAR